MDSNESISKRLLLGCCSRLKCGETVIITKIEVQQKNKQRYSLYVDQKFCMGISEGTLLHFILFVGMEVDEARLDAILEYERQEVIYLHAIHYLARALRSEHEVRTYLTKIIAKAKADLNALEQEDYLMKMAPYIESAIERLKGQGYIDDLFYAESFVRTAMNTNRTGPYVIQMKLKQRGIDQATIEQALAVYPDEVLVENLEQLIAKIKQANRNQPPKKQQQKVIQTLITKGYQRSQIEAALAAVSFEMEEEDQWRLVEQAGQKALRSYAKKYDRGQLWQKIIENLYRKGYDYQLIKQWVEQAKWEQANEDT